MPFSLMPDYNKYSNKEKTAEHQTTTVAIRRTKLRDPQDRMLFDFLGYMAKAIDPQVALDLPYEPERAALFQDKAMQERILKAVDQAPAFYDNEKTVMKKALLLDEKSTDSPKIDLGPVVPAAHQELLSAFDEDTQLSVFLQSPEFTDAHHKLCDNLKINFDMEIEKRDPYQLHWHSMQALEKDQAIQREIARREELEKAKRVANDKKPSLSDHMEWLRPFHERFPNRDDVTPERQRQARDWDLDR